MSLLNVTVKRAKYIGPQAAQLNTYVTLKLQNVKSTTVTVKGQEPCWEQDFLFETNNVNSGLLVEVWNKGMIWDRALGYLLIPLETIPYKIIDDDNILPDDDYDDCDSSSTTHQQQQRNHQSAINGLKFNQPSNNQHQPHFQSELQQQHPPQQHQNQPPPQHQQQPQQNHQFSGQWYPIDMDLILMDGEVSGTKNPTGHMIWLDCRFELPFDPDNHPGDLQRKLELLNGTMTNDRQQRHAQYLGNSGYSEDSDYTSDLNYPVGQNANSSASQYRNLRTPPQHSLETSRENSYERDDRRSPYYDSYNNVNIDDIDNRDNKHNMTFFSPTTDYCFKDENDPMSYNSRPMSSLNYIKGAYNNSSNSTNQSLVRMRSLERQNTLCDSYGSYTADDPYAKDYVNYDIRTDGGGVGVGGSTTLVTAATTDGDGHGYNFYNTLAGDNLSEDRQWDSGGRGTSMNQKILPKIPMKHSSSMVDGIYYNRGATLPPTPLTSKKSRLLPLPGSKQTGGTISPLTIGTGVGAGAGSKMRMLPQPKVGSKRLPTPMLKRGDSDQDDTTTDYLYDQQPTKQTTITSIYNNRPLTSVSATNYNEDYNYAYNSSDSINQDSTTANTPTSVISGFGTSITPRPGGRRKGATLPSVPKLANAVPYTSQSFDNDYPPSITASSYYNDSASVAGDDYYYESSQQRSKKAKKLPMPTTATATCSYSKLPQIPTITATVAMTSSKMLPATPACNSTSYYDDGYSDLTTSDMYMTTSAAITTGHGSLYSPAQTGTAYATSYQSSYKSVTNVDLPSGEPSIKSSGSSVLGTLTTGLKATIGAVGGGGTDLGSSPSTTGASGAATAATTAARSATTASSLTSTAKSYLGLASKFLPNLSGVSGGGGQTTPATATTTIASLITSSVSNSAYSDLYYKSSISTSGQNYSYGTSVTSTSAASTALPASIYGRGSKTTLSSDPYASDYYSGDELDPKTTSASFYGTTTYDSKYGAVDDINDPYDDSKLGSSTMAPSSAAGNAVDYSDYKYGYDEYSCNENDYIATGDITDKKLYNYNNNYDTYDDMVTTSTTATLADSTINIEATKPSSLNYDYSYSSLNSGNVNKNDIYCDNSYNVTGSVVSPTITSATVASTMPVTISTHSHSNNVYLDSMYTTLSSPTTSTSVNAMTVYSPTSTKLLPSTTTTTPLAAHATAATLNCYNSMDQQQTIASSALGFTNNNNNNNNNNNFVPTTTTTAVTNASVLSKTTNGRSPTNLMLVKQQPAEMYEEDDDETTDVSNLSYLNGHHGQQHDESDKYYTNGTSMVAVTAADYHPPGSGSGLSSGDTPYYDYRDDYFNEEDEYKYLESEMMNEQQKQQQQHDHQQLHQFHKKQPPLEYIEESHDDYINDELNDNKSTTIPSSRTTSPTPITTLGHGIGGSTLTTSTMSHGHKLMSQDSISDDTIQQQHLTLKKQDSIRELEDDEKVPSPRDSFAETAMSKEMPSVSKALFQAAHQHSTNGLVSTTASGVGMGIGGGVSIAGIICDVESESFKKKASLQRGETEEVTSGQIMGALRKQDVTGRQRWHWAYNKIIMQLN